MNQKDAPDAENNHGRNDVEAKQFCQIKKVRVVGRAAEFGDHDGRKRFS